jgi:hypothetical protein
MIVSTSLGAATVPDRQLFDCVYGFVIQITELQQVCDRVKWRVEIQPFVARRRFCWRKAERHV